MPQLLDHNGQPFKKGDLRTPQTAQHVNLAGFYNSHPAKGLTPQRLNAILREAELTSWQAQYDLFDDMEQRDTHLFAEMDKRKRAVMGLSWELRTTQQYVPGATTQVYVAGQCYGAGRPWFVWSQQRGRERCIVDDFGSLVAVA